MSKLKSLCSIIVPMRDKPQKFVDEKTGVPWCRIEDIKGKYLYGTITGRFVDRNTIEQMNLKIFPEGTVICACTGASIGTYAITRRDLITNQTFAGLVCGEKLYNHYLYYFVKLYTKAFIDHSVGCAQAYITRETFENIEISDISFEDQKAIVSVLELLDERIENNKAICADLEAMAKLLYDYWFVQFDFPDENGKPYKSSGGKMVWNEELKREIPEGWEVVPISNICTVVSGYPFDSDSYNENGNYHVLTIKNIQDGYVSPITNSNVSEIPSDIPDYDILHIGDILMSLTGNVGRVAVLCGENYLLNQRASLIQPEDSRIKWYLYFLFRSETIFTQIQRVATGTSQKNVSPTDIGNIRIAHSDDIVRAFSSYIESIMQKFVHSNVENQQLAFLRDFLLPMLMNGQVKVGETKE